MSSNESFGNAEAPKNLFRLFCAIVSIPFNQSVSCFIDDRLLNYYTDDIDIRQDEEQLCLAQLSAIKSLVCGPRFILTERQIRLIREKFSNWRENRLTRRSGWKAQTAALNAPDEQVEHMADTRVPTNGPNLTKL